MRRCIARLGEAASVIVLAVLLLCAAAGDSQAKRERERDPRTSVAFTQQEVARLERGKSVKRGFELSHAGTTYQAGLSYRLVEATPMDVIRALRKPA